MANSDGLVSTAMGRTAICTIIAKNYLPHARTLMESVKRFHPECQRFVLLTDHVDRYFEPAEEDFVLDLSEDVTIPKNRLMHFKYRLLELNTAVKPYYLADLFRRYGFEKIVYLDPDIMLFDRLDPIFEALDTATITLTPHLTGILDDNRMPDEWSILASGAYNLGFIGVRRCATVDAFLTWWQRKLYNDCISDIERNLFTDQRWIDLVPGMFPDVCILHDEGLNVAYWNLLHRRITRDEGAYRVNGVPLRFFHFSGFQADNPDAVSRYQDRYRIPNLGRSQLLFEAYRAALFTNGYHDAKDWPYWFGRFTSGEPIPDIGRRVVRDDEQFQAMLTGAYDPDSERRIIAYLNASYDRGADGKVLISRLAYAIYRRREDVQAAFPDPLDQDRLRFARWFVTSGQEQYDLASLFIDPVITSLNKHEDRRDATPTTGADDTRLEDPKIAVEAVATILRRSRGAINSAQRNVTTALESVPEVTPVIIISLAGEEIDRVKDLDTILADASVPVLVAHRTASHNAAAWPTESVHERATYVSLPDAIPAGEALNLICTWCAPRDVVLLSANAIAPPGWFQRLQTVAMGDATIATATTLTNGDSTLSIGWQDWRLRRDLRHEDVPTVDARIQQYALPLRPYLAATGDHCVYIRRTALSAVGRFDSLAESERDAVRDFCTRATVMGFGHVLADDVYLAQRRASASTKSDDVWASGNPRTAPSRADAPDPASLHYLSLERARAALTGYQIAIDATCVDDTSNGTQVVVLELIRALAARRPKRTHITVLLADGTPRQALLGVDEGVDRVMRASDLDRPEHPTFDLIYRPFQVSGISQLAFMRRVATRCVVSELDFIAYTNPSYFPTADNWKLFQRLTQAAFASVDGMTYISQYVADTAYVLGVGHLIDAERQCVTYLGTDHATRGVEARPPMEHGCFADSPFLLILGANFPHKNRAYGIRLLHALATRYNWPGHLVLAGSSAPFGGIDETELVRREFPDLCERVHDLGMISEPAKRWLLENAALVVYPSIQEGFGFIPFEAAAAGTPTLATRMTSIPEMLGPDVSYLDSLDPGDDAAVAWSLLSDPDIASAQVTRIRASAKSFRWEGVADRTWDFIANLLQRPPRRIVGPVFDNLLPEELDRRMQSMIEEKDRYAEAVIAQKDAYIEAIIQQKDEYIKAVIQQSDRLIDALREDIRERERVVTDLRQAGDAAEEVITALQDACALKDAHIGRLESRAQILEREILPWKNAIITDLEATVRDLSSSKAVQVSRAIQRINAQAQRRLRI